MYGSWLWWAVPQTKVSGTSWGVPQLVGTIPYVRFCGTIIGFGTRLLLYSQPLLLNTYSCVINHTNVKTLTN